VISPVYTRIRTQYNREWGDRPRGRAAVELARAVAAGRTPGWFKCWLCREYSPTVVRDKHGTKYHRECLSGYKVWYEMGFRLGKWEW